MRPRRRSGELTASGGGYIKHHVTWTSGGQPMTGTISLPTGAGPTRW